MTFGREPLTIVEIDVDRCSLTYATGLCAAVLGTTGQQKCFNTFFTCQDVENFAQSSYTLRFTYNQSGLPKIAGVFPALASVSTRPSELNLSGIDPKTTALGKRARVEIMLQDFIDDDNYTDLYQAQRVTGTAQFSGVGYDTKRGTFFTKLLARSPYYIGRNLRVKRGYVGDDPSAMDTAHYVISELSGPDGGGAVKITAKDVLDLVDNKKAVAPQPSNGKLLAAIAIDATSFTLTPTGIGDTDYPASGYICVGREIMTFTRSGDVVTLTARGVEGTTASTHSALDVAQICLKYEDERLSDIIADLLTVQGPVDAAFVDTAAWQSEEDSWLGGTLFSAIIPKPVGISTLIGELCQHGAMVWWDEIAQEIRFKVNRPIAPGETVTELNDDANFIEGTLSIDRAEDQRTSALYFWHGTLDPTDTADDGKNYAKLVIALDASSASSTEYGENRIKTIFSRWFGREGNDSFASIIAERIVGRYRDTPLIISGMLDVKDAAIELADIADVTTYLLTDATGAEEVRRVQINKLERKEDKLAFQAETYAIEGRFAFWQDSAVDEDDYDLATDLELEEGAFWIDEADLETGFGDGTGPYVYF